MTGGIAGTLSGVWSGLSLPVCVMKVSERVTETGVGTVETLCVCVCVCVTFTM